MQDKARELLGGRELVFDLNQGQACRFDADVFTRLVDLAVRYGATHMHVGDIPFRYGKTNWVLPDNDDPYAAWCNYSASIFRVCPPPGLQEWCTMEEAERCRAALREALDIMKPHGLKGTVYMPEPMWLPEGVYRAHPRWRGAQCELGRIACRPYFAPNIDDPEVLDLYRRAMREYAELFPEIDEFDFLANDSGSGVPWTPLLYPGLNGPLPTRRNDGGARIANWLKALRDGAADAGVEARFSIHSGGFSPELRESTHAKLSPGTFIHGTNPHGERWYVAGANMSAGLWSAFYPALNLASPGSFVAGLQGVYSNPDADTGRATIGMGAADLPLAEKLMAAVVDNPGKGMQHRLQILLTVAEQLTGGAEHAEALAGAWESVERAQHAMGQIRQKGFSTATPFTTVSMRWLTRPLVPNPETLTPEETAHYRDMLFAPGDTAKDDPHFGYVLGKGVFRGESVMWMTRWCAQEAIDTLAGARGTVEGIAAKVEDEALAAGLRLYAARIGAYRCLCATVKNTIMYQYALDIAHEPQFGPNPVDYDDNMIYDHRSATMRKIAREEVDNIAELVALIESQTEKVIEHANVPEEESVFMLGTDPVADLRRKMDIMLDHWPDYETLYPTCKVWEPDPSPPAGGEDVCGCLGL